MPCFNIQHFLVVSLKDMKGSAFKIILVSKDVQFLSQLRIREAEFSHAQMKQEVLSRLQLAHGRHMLWMGVGAGIKDTMLQVPHC